MGIKQRVSLKKFTDDIRRWVDEDRSDEWIASALGTSLEMIEGLKIVEEEESADSQE